MLLPARADKIIRILVRFPSNQPVTSTVISEELGLSRRSVQRELETVEKWLHRQGCSLTRKPGAGLVLHASAQQRFALLTALEKSCAHGIAEDRESRQKHLHRALLFAKEPLKSQYFTDMLGISEGTLSSDLDEVATVLARYSIKLVRRPGLGIFVEGDEYARRQAISAIVCEEISQQHLLTMLRGYDGNAIPAFSQMMGGLDADIASTVHVTLEKFGHDDGIRFSDGGFISLYVHICLALQRLRQGQTIAMDDERLAHIRTLREYDAAQRMTQTLEASLGINISPAETGFIAVHLSGARIWPTAPRDLTKRDALDVRQMVISVATVVGNALGTNFLHDDILIRDLCNHIEPAIGRLRASIPLENSQLAIIMSDYPEIYAACKEGGQVLCSALGVKGIDPCEIGFLAMHFGAALERQNNRLQHVAVVLVCPTGIGTSRLLAAGLQREFPNLDVRDTISALSLKPENLIADGIALVVSTVPLNIPFRYICVSPVLTAQDKMLLSTTIDALLHDKKIASTPTVITNTLPSRADVDTISMLGQELLALLDGVRIDTAPIISSRAELIEQASMLFSQDIDIQHHFKSVFEARDHIADTYIKPFYALLLHGRTPLVEKPSFGYVRLNPAFYEKGRVVLGAVVMLIPQDTRGDVDARIMSEISGLLLENATLVDAMRAGDTPRFTALLQELLLKFYKRTVWDMLKFSAGGQ